MLLPKDARKYIYSFMNNRYSNLIKSISQVAYLAVKINWHENCFVKRLGKLIRLVIQQENRSVQYQKE